MCCMGLQIINTHLCSAAGQCTRLLRGLRSIRGLVVSGRGVCSAMCSEVASDVAESPTEQSQDECPLAPPSDVRGMIVLDRDRFTRHVGVFALRLPDQSGSLRLIAHHMKKRLLKMRKLPPILTLEQLKPVLVEPSWELLLKDLVTVGEGTAESPTTSSSAETTKLMLLNPAVVGKEDDVPLKDLEELGLDANIGLLRLCLRLGYEHYSAEVVLRSVLPIDQDGCSSFSRIGHIIHLNLKDHLLPYGPVIGAVLLDKHHGVRCVVNKINTIDNTFRNFSMELLAGEEDFVVEARENKCHFRMDFSKVYWNPRLCTEHERVVSAMTRGDRVYDAFAGVGPFAMPAGKKGYNVLANDLNPESFRWLEENIKVNKVGCYVQAFNMCGRDFIQTVVKQDILEQLKTEGTGQVRCHVVMNLPAMAMQFVDAFVGIFSSDDSSAVDDSNLHLLAHVYTFTKEVETADQSIVCELNAAVGQDVTEHVQQVAFVRNVAPNKHMYRVTWRVPKKVLLGCSEEPPTKKSKLNDLVQAE